MKYIDADKLIAEIERWRDKAKEKYNESTYSMGRCDALAEFRNYIVSLQQEPPEDTDTLRAKLVNFLIRNHIQEDEAKYLADRISDTYGAQRYLDGLWDAANAYEQQEQPEDIMVPRWCLENIEDTLRIQNNINSEKETGETCQDRNIRCSLNQLRKLLNGKELTGIERMEPLQEQPVVFDTMAFQKGVKEGKRLAIETIQSRIDEILGDAQPAPILRAELQELIKKIKA